MKTACLYIAYFLLTTMCLSCNLTLEETFIEGKNNTVTECSKDDAEARVRANVKAPLLDI